MAAERLLLLVDDEENITRALKRLFRTQGYRILSASGGPAALALLKEHPIQVVLSDQLMPEMTGSELFREIEATHPDVVRILLTGYTALEGITDAVNNGRAFRILFKPWDDDSLKRTVKEAFEFQELKGRAEGLATELSELNQHLERRVREQTRDLQIHMKRLEISDKILESVPLVALGLSDSLLIVQANACARQLFEPMALLGQSAQRVFGDDMRALLEDIAQMTPDNWVRRRCSVQSQSIEFFCARVQITPENYGIVLFGSPCL